MKIVTIVFLFLFMAQASFYLHAIDNDVTNYGRKVAGSTPLVHAPRERVGTYVRASSVRNSDREYIIYPTANMGYSKDRTRFRRLPR